MYNGNTNATLTLANFSLTPLVGSENFSVTQTVGTYNSKNVLTATTVTASLAAGAFSPTNGAIASNYVLPTSASGPGHITKADATVVVTPYTVVYDLAPHTAKITSINGVNYETGATVGTVDVSNTTHTNPGSYTTDYWFFTGTANYYNIGNTTITDTITFGNCAGSGVILQPINADGSSVFPKSGRTVPVKFIVCDAFGNPIHSYTFVGRATDNVRWSLVNAAGEVETMGVAEFTDADSLPHPDFFLRATHLAAPHPQLAEI